MVGVLLVDFDFRVAPSTTWSWTECMVGDWSTSGVSELRGLIFLSAAHTVISSFLVCASSNILEVLSIRLFNNMLPSWCKVLQILWQQYGYIWHPLPLIKCPPCPPFSEPLSPLPADIPSKHLHLLRYLTHFILHYPTYLVFNLFDHEIILMHVTDPSDLIPSTLYDNQSPLLNLWHYDVLQGCILLPGHWLKHLLLILSIAATGWARDWVIGVLVGRDADGEG